MRKDHTPLLLKRLQRWREHRFIQQQLAPQFQSLGKHPQVNTPRSVEIFGDNIQAGDYLHIVSEMHQPVKLTTWQSKQQNGRLTLGHYCLISPGVTISASDIVSIGDNCMVGAECYISDCDWHGVYNRIRPFRCSAGIQLKNNVWVGFRSIITKGVTIGENSIVGAGSVVTQDVPDNVVVAGNPAKVVKTLNPRRRMLTRAFLFQDERTYWVKQNALEDAFLSENSWFRWMRTQFSPSRKD